jgi:hypothetical protein
LSITIKGSLDAPSLLREFGVLEPRKRDADQQQACDGELHADQRRRDAHWPDTQPRRA